VALTVAAGGPPGSLIGLDRARAVVEYPIATDRTGLFVLLDIDAEVLGPLRSATPSDAALASGYGADLVTARTTGGVVTELAESDLSVFEEHTVAGALVRDPSRQAPFNLYAVPDAVRAAVGEREAATPGSSGVVPTDGQAGDGTQQNEVTVQVVDDRAITWTLEANAGHWLRTAGGRLEQSATGERIGADIVLVYEAQATRDDSGDREARPPVIADLTGSGTAQVLRDGMVFDARWERSGTAALPTIRGGGDLPSGATTWVHVCAAPCTAPPGPA